MSKPKFRTDFCSVPGWLGFFPFFRKYNKLFKPACAGHDWLYHNAYSLGMSRLACDLEFYLMMLDVAKSLSSSEAQQEAMEAAWVYYKGVRIGGKGSYKEMWDLWKQLK